MKKLLLLAILFLPAVANAQTVTPQFTQGSMNATTDTTQTITETITTNVYGGDYKSWSGANVTPSGAVNDPTTTYTVTDTTLEFQLETVERAAGLVENIVIDRVIDTTSTTTSLSVFSQ
jgi:hypothetical protein